MSNICNLIRNTGYTITIAFLIVIVSGCSSLRYNNQKDNWFGKDKLYHFTACSFIGAGTTLIANNNWTSDIEAPVAGVSVAVGVGAGKEFCDLTVKETFWSWKDIFWNLAGGAAGSYAVSKCY